MRLRAQHDGCRRHRSLYILDLMKCRYSYGGRGAELSDLISTGAPDWKLYTFDDRTVGAKLKREGIRWLPAQCVLLICSRTQSRYLSAVILSRAVLPLSTHLLFCKKADFVDAGHTFGWFAASYIVHQSYVKRLN